MAWEWSHTDEAIVAVEHFVKEVMVEEIIFEIAVEWLVWYLNDKSGTAGSEWEFEVMKLLQKIEPKNEEWIWERAEEQRTCDNGGYNLWICPYGCPTHCVNVSAAMAFMDS